MQDESFASSIKQSLSSYTRSLRKAFKRSKTKDWLENILKGMKKETHVSTTFQETYASAAESSGKGSLQRMKSLVEEEIKTGNGFKNMEKFVQDELEKILIDFENGTRMSTDRILGKVNDAVSVWYDSSDKVTDAGKEGRDKLKGIVEDTIKEAKKIEGELIEYVKNLDTY